jgi:hypothetical protein
MSNITRHALSTGLQIDLERYQGEVVGFNEQAVTTVHQSTQLVDGIVRPGVVSSGVETLKSAWLRGADGIERRFDFSALDVEARLGHRLTVILAAAPNGEPQLFAVHNASTNMTFWRSIGGRSSQNNDFARATFFPGVFPREAKIFAAIGAVLLLLPMIGDGYIKDLWEGPLAGAILGFIAWVVALLLGLSPARRKEMRTYPEIESLVQSQAEAA